MKIRNPRRKDRRAFTLTEMLIVLAILVMLVALVVPRFLGASKKADRQTTETQIGLLRGALERYALDMKDFPTTEQGLQALLSPPAAGDVEGTSTTTTSSTPSSSSWAGPYLNKNELPKDAWGNEYQYVYPPERGSGDFPDIWSLGPDREDNTQDDICSWGGGNAAEGDEFGAETGEDMNMDVDVDVDLPPEPAMPPANQP
jgi:general secretion pathway protein G